MRRATTLLFIVALASFASKAAAQQGTWQPRLTLHSGNFNAISYVSASNVVAGGLGGIMLSQDGGRIWSWVSNDSVLDVDVAGDGQHAWAVGYQGTILSTADAGRTWTTQSSGTNLDLYDVAAFDAQTALAVGTRFNNSDVPPIGRPPDILLRTDDGGQTWRKVPFPPDYAPGKLAVLRGGDRGWLTAGRCAPDPSGPGACAFPSGPALFRSDDKGQSWTKIDEGRYFSALTFVSARVGWAEESRAEADQFIPRNLVLRTEDGGASWKTVHDSTKAGASPGSLVAFGERTLVLLEHDIDGGNTRMLKTEDAGATWKQLGQPEDDSIGALAYRDESHGLRIGMNTSMSWTDDGKTWNAASTPTFVGRYSGAFDFVDASNGWVAGSRLLRTRDGGRSWEAVSDLQPAQIDFVSPSEGWAIQPICPHSSCTYHVLHTIDGGSNWEAQANFQKDEPEGLLFADSLNGWISRGEGQAALRTRDGGRTWQEWQPPADKLAFVDGNVVWAAGQSRTPGDTSISLFLSQDGGASWLPAGTIQDPAVCEPDLVAASDARHAWVLLYKCDGSVQMVLYRTVDGGEHWQALPLEGFGSFQVLSFSSLLSGMAVRGLCSETDPYQPCHEVLMRTNDGGLSWSYEPTPFQGFYFERFRFLSPYSGWAFETIGGGIEAVGTQNLYAYDSPPSESPGRIDMPGVGEGQGDEAPPVALLGVMGILFLTIGGIVGLRRRQRDG
jgi:photosystem II stability/assembly factor-like uncharacterized protein